VDEAVVVHADVDERTERRHVRHDALEHHAGLEIFHRRDVIAEGGRRELGARIATGFGKLGHDVAQRRFADVALDVLREVDLVDELLVADEGGQLDAEVLRHLLDERVALGMDCRGVERVL
jgi:hypothetical protein